MRLTLFSSFILFYFSSLDAVALDGNLPNLRLATSQLSSDTIPLEIDTERSVREQVECVLSRMQFGSSIQTKPWNRIYHDLQRGQLDGFFSALPRKQMDAFAEISVPLVIENWYWFWRPGIDAPDSWQKGYKLGSILGSQQEKWLEESGYTISMSANHLPQLIKMLNTGRIDVILVDREHFFQAISHSNLSVSDYELRFFRYVPLGAYFSESFLQKNPGFLNRFNYFANQCSTQTFWLSDNEKKQIEQLVAGFYRQWEETDNWRSQLLTYKKTRPVYSDETIALTDKAWMNAFQHRDDSVLFTLTDTDLGKKLHAIKAASAGVITEIILVDERGLNLAVSDMTSDFYQGDETKFILAKKLTTNQYFVDEIAHDASTRLFQVNVSFPLFDKNKPARLLGFMIIGLNVEKALSLSH